ERHARGPGFPPRTPQPGHHGQPERQLTVYTNALGHKTTYEYNALGHVVRETDIDVVMLAGRYTLLEQTAAAEFLPLCVERGVRILAAGVFNSGLLARNSIPDNAKYNYVDAPAAVVQRAQRIAEVCSRYDVTLPQAAVQFVLRHPAVASVVLGVKSADQVRRNASLFSGTVPEQLWTDLRAEGLLDAS
ncbi:aldo/keto reductase, partial [Kibdelosporangium lantanae]